MLEPCAVIDEEYCQGAFEVPAVVCLFCWAVIQMVLVDLTPENNF
jgi:hypothetical protein